MGNLKKQTKTILLHNGMQDDVDDFLIESPAVERVENGVFDKQGVISKRRGFEALPDPDLSLSTDGTPSALIGGSTLLLPYNRGIKTYNEDDETWTDVSGKATFTSVAQRFSTTSGVGACHFHVATISGKTCTVYELASDQFGSLDTMRVAIELRDARDILVSTTYVDGYSPQVVAMSSYFVITYLANDTDVKLKSVRLTASTGTFSSTRTSTLTNIASYEESTAVGSVDARYSYRFLNWRGESADLGHSGRPNYKLGIRSATTCAVVFVVDEGSGLGDDLTIVSRTITATSPSAAPTVAAQTTVKAEIVSPSVGAYVKILDWVLVGTTQYVLYSSVDYGDVNHVLVNRLRITDGSTTQTLEEKDFEHTGGTYWTGVVYTCGTIAWDGDDRLWVGASRVGFQGVANGALATGVQSDIVPNTTLYTVPTTLSAETVRHVLYGHRLASKGLVDSDTFYVCLQQWSQRAPQQILKGNADGDRVSPLHYARPYTTFVCSVTTADVTVRANITTGRSLTVANNAGANDSTLPELTIDDGVVTVLSPVVEEPAIGNFVRDAASIANGMILSTEDAWVSVGQRRAELWDITLEAVPTAVRTSGGHLLTSGVPLWFDGHQICEATPLVAPEVLHAASPDIDEALTVDVASTADTIGLYLLYSYMDARGNLRRSAPGNIARIGVDRPGGGTNVEYLTLYYTSPLSLRSGDGALSLEVYLLSDGVYKRIATHPVEPGSNDVQRVTVRVGDVVDPVETSGRLLYTEGGGLPADTIPSCQAFVQTGGRVFGVTNDPRATLISSKPLTTGVGPEFPQAQYQPLSASSIVVGIAGMDDKVVVFGEDDIHILYGQGPDASGRGGAFGLMRLPSEVGCSDAKSIVEVPSGIIFRGRRGFYLLGRDLGLKSLRGADDMLVGMTVVNATAIPTTGEVRFLLSETGTQLDSDGPTPDSTRPAKPKYGNSGMVAGFLTQGHALCYNYERDQWSIFTNYRGVSATLLNGVYVCLKNDYDVWVESETVFTDPEVTNATVSSNLLRITTPWIKLNGLQSYGRIWSATFLGRYLSDFTEDENGDLAAGDITIKVAYDYEKDDTQTHVFKASEELQPELRDGEIISAQRLQIKVVPKRQKCSAIRFTIEETDTADADGLTYRPGQGFEIPAIELELGMKDTANKSLSAQRKK